LSKHKKNYYRNIKRIEYFCNVPKNIPITNEQKKIQYTYSSSPIPQSSNNEVINITIDPCIYTNKQNINSLETINKKWFVNLTHHVIPNKVQCLLLLEQNFALPSTNTKYIIHQLIKNIENNINKLHPDIQTEIRNRCIPLIHNLTSTQLHTDPKNNNIHKLFNITKNFTKNNPNIIFTRANKGNITVAMERENYINSVEEILNDTETYTRISKDPTKNSLVTSEVFSQGGRLKAILLTPCLIRSIVAMEICREPTSCRRFINQVACSKLLFYQLTALLTH